MSLTKKVILSAFILSISGCGKALIRTYQPTLPNQDPITNPNSPGSGGNNSTSGNPPGGPTGGGGGGAGGGGGQSNPSNPSLGTALGKSSYAVTANRSVIGIGSADGNHYAVIRTFEKHASPGSYYGLGTGNMGLIGFGAKYDRHHVKSFESLSFRSKPISENSEKYSENAYVKVIVDLNCDPLNPEYRVFNTANFRPKTLGEWNTYEIKRTDAVFKSSKNCGKYKTLEDWVAQSPNACFVAADPLDSGMKRDQRVAPFNIAHGDAFYDEDTAVYIDDVTLKISGETHTEDFE